MKDRVHTADFLKKNTSTLALLHKRGKEGQSLCALLAERGYEVKLFYSKWRMLSWLRSNTAEIVLVDIDGSDEHQRLIMQVRGQLPLLPVVAISRSCSVERVRQSLRNGAHHFITDATDTASLFSTIDRLVNFRMEHLRYVQILPHMSTKIEASIPSRLELLGGMVFYLTEELFKHGLISLDHINVKIAFIEALTNAMEHGNKLDPKKLVRVIAEFNHNEARVRIIDEGPGFDFNALPDPTLKENLFRPRGRGIFMMRQFMDDVIFEPPGNQVILVKKRAGDGVSTRPYPWERRMV